MKKVYITITGMDHYHGTDFLENGVKVRLIKDPDNKYDHEAIRVEMEGLGKIGYVANSTYTVLGDSMSAGRLYDRIGQTVEILHIERHRIMGVPLAVAVQIIRIEQAVVRVAVTLGHQLGIRHNSLVLSAYRSLYTHRQHKQQESCQ